MDTQTLVSVLTWALITVGTGLIWSVVWFALRIVKQLDRLEQLFTDKTNSHDSRLISLEEWRRMVGSRPGSNISGMD